LAVKSGTISKKRGGKKGGGEHTGTLKEVKQRLWADDGTYEKGSQKGIPPWEGDTRRTTI